MTPEQKLAELAKKARIRSERARKKAAEQGRGAMNLILSAHSRKVLEALAGRFGSKSAVIDHLCDRVLIAGDPGFEAERDGLAGASVAIGAPGQPSMAECVAASERVNRPDFGQRSTPDNPTKSLAAQGKTRDKGPAKTPAKPSVQIGPVAVAPGSRLKQPKVKK